MSAQLTLHVTGHILRQSPLAGLQRHQRCQVGQWRLSEAVKTFSFFPLLLSLSSCSFAFAVATLFLVGILPIYMHYVNWHLQVRISPVLCRRVLSHQLKGASAPQLAKMGAVFLTVSMVSCAILKLSGVHGVSPHTRTAADNADCDLLPGWSHFR